MKIITNRNHSYFINDLTTVELGSMIFDTEVNKMYILLEPNTLTEIDAAAIPVETLEALAEAIAAGGNIAVEANIDAPTGFAIAANTTITNNAEITIT